MGNFIRILIGGTAGAALAGCGLDDVQLNGKVFDTLGMNTGSTPKKTPDVAARSPLVVPPSLDKLPEPGAAAQGGAGTVAEIQDYDEKRRITRADVERQQAEYCKKHYTDAKVLGDQDAEQATGPLGPCHGSAFQAVKQWTSGSDQ